MKISNGNSGRSPTKRGECELGRHRARNPRPHLTIRPVHDLPTQNWRACQRDRSSTPAECISSPARHTHHPSHWMSGRPPGRPPGTASGCPEHCSDRTAAPPASPNAPLSSYAADRAGQRCMPMLTSRLTGPLGTFGHITGGLMPSFHARDTCTIELPTEGDAS
jgi:hypothetical protein